MEDTVKRLAVAMDYLGYTNDQIEEVIIQLDMTRNMPADKVDERIVEIAKKP